MILVCRYFFFPAFAVAVAFRKLPETNLCSIKFKKKYKATTPKQKIATLINIHGTLHV